MKPLHCLFPVLLLLTAAKSPEPRQRLENSGAPRAVTGSDQPSMLSPYSASAERYFHVDDFAGLAPDYAPIQGTQSLWCGRRPDPAMCWLGVGYPANSVQIFESVQLPVNHWDVNLDFLAKWSVEASYDFIYVEASSNTHGWETTVLASAGSGFQSLYTTASPGGWVKFRFRVVSDYAFDGEDGQFAQPGSAIVLDSLYVRDGTGAMVDYQSFESEAVGAMQTADGDWAVDAVYVVSSTADSGPGTLRDGITATNANSSLNRIVFDIPGAGPHSIQPLSALPAITEYLYIDGFTQPGASVNTNPPGSPGNEVMKIELYGFMAGFMSNGLLFQERGKVRGLVLNHWGQSAIRIEAGSVFVEGNFIGPNVDGVTSGGFNSGGVHITGNHSRVGGCSPAARNVVSGNSDGVIIGGSAAYNRIHGNHVGIGADAATPLGNTYGVRINGTAHDNVVGSGSAAVDLLEVNKFANNTSFGILVDGTAPYLNVFWGNSFHEDFRAIEIGNNIPPDPANVNVYSAEGSAIHGQISGPPNATGRIHFYRSDACGGPWGTGYAETYIGVMSKNSGPTGVDLFDFTIPQPIPPGCWITATVTFSIFPSTLNTSELSVCVQHQNTPAGGSAVVDLLDEELNVRGTATYEQVDSPGNTVFTNPFEPPVWLEAPFDLPEPEKPLFYYDIATDASYTGNIEVCLNYNEADLVGSEEYVVLMHFNGSQWENVTTSRDTDNNVVCGVVSSLSPFAIATAIPTGVNDVPAPASFTLHGNVPNPFNPVTTISFDIPVGGADVTISVYDVAGRRVRELVSERRPAGTWSVQWNGHDDRGRRVASGVYFYRMRAGGFVDTKKMVLLK